MKEEFIQEGSVCIKVRVQHENLDLRPCTKIADNNAILDLNDLMMSRQKLQNFIICLGNMANTQIPNEVLSCFQSEKQNFSSITPHKIMKMADERIEKMIKNKRLKRNWSVNDIIILVWTIGKMCEQGSLFVSELREDNKNWKKVAALIPGATSKNCMFKWLSLKKTRITSNSWSREQEKLLGAVVKRIGINKWKQASRQLYENMKTAGKVYRHPKQCRQHWRCFLDPSLRKGTWDKVEDKLLLQTILRNNGAKKWSKICLYFKGRTQNSVKNRFRILLERMKQAYSPNNVFSVYKEVQSIELYLKNILQNVPSVIEERINNRKVSVEDSNEDDSGDQGDQRNDNSSQSHVLSQDQPEKLQILQLQRQGQKDRRVKAEEIILSQGSHHQYQILLSQEQRLDPNEEQNLSPMVHKSSQLQKGIVRHQSAGVPFSNYLNLINFQPLQHGMLPFCYQQNPISSLPISQSWYHQYLCSIYNQNYYPFNYHTTD